MFEPKIVSTLCLVLSLSACNPDDTGGSPGADPTDSSPTDSEVPPTTSDPTSGPGPTLLDIAADSLGGADTLNTLTALSISASAEVYSHGEGYEPGEPDVMGVTTSTQTTIDIAADRLHIDTERTFLWFGMTLSYGEALAGGAGLASGCDSILEFCTAEMPGARVATVDKVTRLLNPHLVIRDVLDGVATATEDGSTLLVSDDSTLEPLRLVFDTDGALLEMRTWETGPVLGDVDFVAEYGDWSETSEGLRYPATVTLGVGEHTLAVETGRVLTANGAVDDNLFVGVPTEPADTDDQQWGSEASHWFHKFTSWGFPFDMAQQDFWPMEVAPGSGVFLIVGGSHNSAAVLTADGIVLLEAPLHERQMDGVVDMLDATFGGMPITHVVSSHHHHDHTGGLRRVLAEGATLVASEHGVGFYEDLVATPFSVVPDTFASAGVTPTIEGVSGETKIGPNNDVVLYPLTTSHASDMVLAYLPSIQGVFVVDLYNPDPYALAEPLEEPYATTAQELIDGIEDLGIPVSVVLGGHGFMVSYDEAVAHITQ